MKQYKWIALRLQGLTPELKRDGPRRHGKQANAESPIELLPIYYNESALIPFGNKRSRFVARSEKNSWGDQERRSQCSE
jgi:hypothetical protein